MTKPINFSGQWVGHFAYGSEYGDDLAGEKVQFRIFVDDFKEGQFSGRSVDLEGVGSNFEVAKIKGYIDQNFISFTKEYPHYYGFDEEGNVLQDKDRQHPLVAYSGEYDQRTKAFAREWELTNEIEPLGDGWLEEICTGT